MPPRDPQILCCSAEPLLASPLVGRSDGQQCQHANPARRQLPPSFLAHAARQWQRRCRNVFVGEQHWPGTIPIRTSDTIIGFQLGHGFDNGPPFTGRSVFHHGHDHPVFRLRVIHCGNITSVLRHKICVLGFTCVIRDVAEVSNVIVRRIAFHRHRAGQLVLAVGRHRRVWIGIVCLQLESELVGILPIAADQLPSARQSHASAWSASTCW